MTRLADIRKSRLLTQEDLATKAGVAERTIHLIETGRTAQPRIKVMRALCQVLGVPPQDVDEFRAALNLGNSTVDE
jgi:transcriptional regulator with XRE-family HTH domain